jgi:hypothetical protein
MDHYNWMVAEFNNDTSVIPTLISLFLTHDGTVQIAEPNYYLYPEGTPPRTPIDPQYVSGLQISLRMIGMDTAWGLDVGEMSIAVAIVDGGADFFRCDLGGGMIPNDKVEGGYAYPYNDMSDLYQESWHGTQVASIIGALTNNDSCSSARTDTANGMAGIAGGFNGAERSPNLGMGVKLYVYNVFGEPGFGEAGPWLASYVASAILAASAHSLSSPYGDSADLINLSGGYRDTLGLNAYSVTVRNALSEAWKNGVTFVCGDPDGDSNIVPNYPPYYEPSSEKIVVSGTYENKSRQPGVNWGFHTDLLAPGGTPFGPTGDSTHISDALQTDPMDGPLTADSLPDPFASFGGTSAATPHVTGVAALLRGWMNTNGMAYAREDIRGMLDASALDLGNPARDPAFPRTDPDGTQYITGFDDHSGWGFLQADSLFTMLDPIGNYQYHLAHVEIPFDSLHFPAWDTALDYKNEAIYVSTDSLDNIPDTVGIFDVKIREVTGTYSYAGLGFNQADSLYVWGNSGIGLWDTVHRGMANVLPNWSEKWCGVTSGLLGNQGKVVLRGDTIYTNIGVPGIHHGYSAEVTCHTYQYQLFKHGDTAVYGYLPDSSKIGLGYTVFGATNFMSGVKNSVQEGSFNVWPSIATTTVHVMMENSETASHFVLFDEIGREVFEQNLLPGTTQFEVPVSDLTSGIYLGRITNSSCVRNAKIIIQH